MYLSMTIHMLTYIYIGYELYQRKTLQTRMGFDFIFVFEGIRICSILNFVFFRGSMRLISGFRILCYEATDIKIANLT